MHVIFALTIIIISAFRRVCNALLVISKHLFKPSVGQHLRNHRFIPEKIGLCLNAARGRKKGNKKTATSAVNRRPREAQIRLSADDGGNEIAAPRRENTAFLLLDTSAICKNNRIMLRFSFSPLRKKKCSDETTKMQENIFVSPSFLRLPLALPPSSWMLIFILIASNHFFSHLKNVYV